MGFDIYGNQLRRGYCEVHPQVNEEYPCSLCLSENRHRNDDRQQEMDCHRQLEAYYSEIEQNAIAFKDWCDAGNAWTFDNQEQHTHTTEELYKLFQTHTSNTQPKPGNGCRGIGGR